MNVPWYSVGGNNDYKLSSDELKKLDERIEDLRKNEEENKAEFKRLEKEKLALIHELFIMGQKRLQAQMNYEKSKLWFEDGKI